MKPPVQNAWQSSRQTVMAEKRISNIQQGTWNSEVNPGRDAGSGIANKNHQALAESFIDVTDAEKMSVQILDGELPHSPGSCFNGFNDLCTFLAVEAKDIISVGCVENIADMKLTSSR